MIDNKRKYIPGVTAVLLFAITSAFCLNAIAARTIRARRDAQRYELNVVERNGKGSVLLCYAGGKGYNYHFLLNPMIDTYPEIHIEKGKTLDTKLPVPCVKYPFESIEVESRYGVMPPKRPGEERFVFIGDSFTFGEGVPLENAFPQTLERLLRNRGRKNVRMLNFGRAGITFPQIFTINFQAALKAAPDHIVYVWTPGNVPLRKDGSSAVADVNTAANTLNHLEGSGPALTRLIKNKIAAKRLNARIVSKFKAAYSPQSGNLTQLRQYFRIMNEQARMAGADFEVVLYPQLICNSREYPFQDIHATVVGILKSEHIPATDLSGALRFPCSSNLWEHPTDHHPSVLAHYLFASALAEQPGIFHAKVPSTPAYAQRSKLPEPAASPPGAPDRMPGFAPLFFYVSLLFVLLLISAAANASFIRRELLRENLIHMFLLVLIVAAAFALRTYLSPHVHQTYNDEFDRFHIIRLWIHGVYSANTSDNIPGSLLPFFIAHKIFGLQPSVEYTLTVLFSAATVLMLYAAVRVSGLGRAAAFTAALLLAVCPPSVKFAASQNIDTLNAFFLTLCWFAVMYDIRYGGFRARMFMVSALAFALFVRIDNVAVIALMTLFHMGIPLKNSGADTPDSHSHASTNSAGAMRIFPSAILVSSFAVWTTYALVCLRTTAQYSHVFSARNNIGTNLDGNLAFFVNNAAFPTVFTLAAAFGIILVEARRQTMDTRLRIVRFLLLWLLIVFIIQLCSAAGGYDYLIFKDTTRYVINFLPPLLVLAAVGACEVLRVLPGKTLKSAALAGAAAYMLFTVPLFSNFINSQSHFSRINQALLETAIRYKPEVTFVTNSSIAYYVLAMDAGRRTAYTQDPAKAASFCENDQECVFVLYRSGMMRELDALDLHCSDRILIENISILFVPIQEIHRVPSDFLKTPDPTPPTGSTPHR